MTTMLDVASNLETAGRLVACLKSEWWTGGIVYILEVLEETAPDDSHLRKLQDAIDKRLKKGRW